MKLHLKESINPKEVSITTYLSLATTIVLWGGSFPAIKIGLLTYSPLELAVIRFVVASFLLFIFCLKNSLRVLELKDIPIFLSLALVGVVGYHLLLNYGEQLTSAGTAGFIVNVAPIFTLILAHFIFQEKLSVKKCIGALVAFAGVWTIYKSANGALKFNTGLIILLLGALAWSLFFIIQKAALKRYSSFEVVCYTVWIAALMFLFLSHPITLAHKFLDSRFTSALAPIYLGIFSTSVAYLLWAYTLSNMPVSQASIYTYGVPLISMGFSCLLLGEHYNTRFLIGGALIVLGMLISHPTKYFLHRQTRST